MKLDPVKIVLCLNCGAEVNINANYPIESVMQCRNCGLYEAADKVFTSNAYVHPDKDA